MMRKKKSNNDIQELLGHSHLDLDAIINEYDV